MRNIYDIAQYIIKYYVDITEIKLQMLLYYCQARALGEGGTPLFNEDFEAWEIGPIVPELHNSMHNDPRYLYNNIIHTNIDNMPYDNQRYIRKTINEYGEMSANDLAALARNENPWIEAWDANQPNQIISKNALRNYYIFYAFENLKCFG